MSELREKALEILSSGDKSALHKVEKLLGAEGRNLPLYKIARSLEIPDYRLKYLLTRDYQLKQQRKKRIYQKQANAIPGFIISSVINGFSIWLPEGWQVIDDHIEDEPEEYGRYVGLFSTSSPMSKSTTQERVLEVVKFRLKRPMSAVELYYAEKAKKDLVYGGRMRHVSVAEGLDGVASHGVYRGVDPNMYDGGYGDAFFSTHIVYGLNGWAINCWNELDDRFRSRPVFRRIVASFYPYELEA